MPKSYTYEDFVAKFQPKRTTDDCITPPIVYEAVLDWTCAEFGITPDQVVRPFWPGGDYQAEDYAPDAVVVDNPPFSILNEILRFYTANGIRFMLFAPTLTLFAGRDLDVCYLCADAKITYENGAQVNTSFVTNLDTVNRLRTVPKLNEAVNRANAINQERLRKTPQLKYAYPWNLLHAARVSKWSNYGIDFRVPKEHAKQVSALDAQREHKLAIYGSGFLIGAAEAAKAAKAAKAAEAAKAAKAAKAAEVAEAAGVPPELINEDGQVVWQLSPREQAIVDSLGR